MGELLWQAEDEESTSEKRDYYNSVETSLLATRAGNHHHVWTEKVSGLETGFYFYLGLE